MQRHDIRAVGQRAEHLLVAPGPVAGGPAGTPLLWLKRNEVSALDLDVLHNPFGGDNPDCVLLEQVAEAAAVDQVDRWCRPGPRSLAAHC